MYQLRWPYQSGGANTSSLIQAQQNVARLGVADEDRLGRQTADRADYDRDLHWRPINGGIVTVHTEAHGDTSVLRVENTGRRIPPELIPPLTEPFQRGPERVRTNEHAGVGVGLSLAIVHSIVRAHHGTLDLVPDPAGGLLVTVRLPSTP